VTAGGGGYEPSPALPFVWPEGDGRNPPHHRESEPPRRVQRDCASHDTVPEAVSVYLQDPDVTILQGDSLELLRGLPDGSVHMACTSPPFYGLRDYNAEGQIGLEATPDEWVERLVGVFRELRRVLRDDGTLWVEIGDSYATQRNDHPGGGFRMGEPDDSTVAKRGWHGGSNKPKDLIGAPWLLAFALRADGWFLRSEIIWAKPNPMPESVSDRPTQSHSRVFLLTKRARYFYDAEAIRETHTGPWDERWAAPR
jgi:DNA modification methylase